MALAPIALFAYRRIDHLARTLDALEACPEFCQSAVTVYSDGPKSEAARGDVSAVRALLVSRRRPNMTIIEASSNRGLANSIIAGVTEQCRRYGKVIVFEDDLVVSPVALTWLNRGLDLYERDIRVWQVGAHQFPVAEFASRPDGMFLKLSTSWGWGTWQRAWDCFDSSASGWQALSGNAELSSTFDLNGSYPYTAMMEQQVNGLVDSWAIRWWWSVFQAGGLGLFPPRSLVSNIGQDSTATHAASLLRRLIVKRPLQQVDLHLPEQPSAVEVDEYAQKAIEEFLRAQTGQTRWKAILARLGA